MSGNRSPSPVVLLTLDVHCPVHPNGAGLISIVSGAWQSSLHVTDLHFGAPAP